MYHVVTGALWIVSILTVLAFLFPGIRELYDQCLSSLLDGEAHLPEAGDRGYLGLLIGCSVYALGLWFFVTARNQEGVVTTTLLMILFGAVHCVALYLLIGVLLRMLILGIALMFFILMVGGGRMEQYCAFKVAAKTLPEQNMDT